MSAFTNIDFPLSDICNLTCSFCYTKGGCGNKYDQAHVDKSFDWIFKQFEDNATPEQRKRGMTINIYGGEPLIEWNHIITVIPEKMAIAKQKGIPMTFVIVTNMTLMTDEKLDWLIANNVGIGMSIDGCAEAQDIERRFVDGTGSSSIVFENAKKVIKRTKFRTVRMTVSPSSVHVLFKSVKFLVKEIGFTNINSVPAGGVDWTSEKLDIFKDQLDQITAFWLDEMRRGRYFSVWHLKKVFEAMKNINARQSLCGACKSLIGIDTNGILYPCHRFCNPGTAKEYELGTIETGITHNKLLDEVANFNFMKTNQEHCKNCPAILGCKTYCMHEMLLENNNLFIPTNHHCILTKHYWKLAIYAHSIMIAEGNRVYKERVLGQKRPTNTNKSTLALEISTIKTSI